MGASGDSGSAAGGGVSGSAVAASGAALQPAASRMVRIRENSKRKDFFMMITSVFCTAGRSKCPACRVMWLMYGL